MTLDAAAMLCCCSAESTCCPLTSVLMSMQSTTISFDFQFVSPVDGQMVRRFTGSGTTVDGIIQQGPIQLTADLMAPIVLNRFGPGASDVPFGSIGRCGYRGLRTVIGAPFSGWGGGVFTHLASLPATYANSTFWDGRAIPQGASSGTISYYLRPFQRNGWNQTGAPWAFEVGIVCGRITASMIAAWPLSGCPTNLSFAPGSLAGSFTYFRGRVHDSGTLWGSLNGLTEPTYTQQVVQAVADSYPAVPFSVTIT